MLSTKDLVKGEVYALRSEHSSWYWIFKLDRCEEYFDRGVFAEDNIKLLVDDNGSTKLFKDNCPLVNLRIMDCTINNATDSQIKLLEETCLKDS